MRIYKAIIDGVEYGMDKIYSIDKSHSVFETLSIGNASAAKLVIVYQPDEMPSRAAHVKILFKETPEQSSWYQFGAAYVDTRHVDAYGRLTLECYDGMLKAEQPFTWTEDDPTPWAVNEANVIRHIVELTGLYVTFDYTTWTRNVLKPTNYTCRELLKQIAAAHGGNFFIDKNDELYFDVLSTLSTLDIGKSVQSFTASDNNVTVSYVSLIYDEEAYKKHEGGCYTIGDTSGYGLVAFCPWATKDIAQQAYIAVNGYVYNAFTADGVVCNLNDITLGRRLRVCGVTTNICDYRIVITADGAKVTLSAPDVREIEHEFLTSDDISLLSMSDDTPTQASVKTSGGVIRLNVGETTVELDADKLQRLENLLRG